MSNKVNLTLKETLENKERINKTKKKEGKKGGKRKPYCRRREHATTECKQNHWLRALQRKFLMLLSNFKLVKSQHQSLK